MRLCVVFLLFDNMGLNWNRQECTLYSKHVGAGLLTPSTNGFQTLYMATTELHWLRNLGLQRNCASLLMSDTQS